MSSLLGCCTWMSLLLLAIWGLQGVKGDASGCKVITGRIVDEELVLNSTTLDAADNSVQRILDCVPPKTKILATVDKIPVGEEGLIINKPVTFGSKVGMANLLCSSGNITIRSSSVTLQKLNIKGCVRGSQEGIITIENVENIVLDSIVFNNNTNTEGPSCISGKGSTIALQNITATDNCGGEGGFLSMIDSKVNIIKAKFYHNSALKVSGANGGVLHLKGSKSNLRVENANFVNNMCSNHGGAISLEDGNLSVAGSNFTGNEANITAEKPEWNGGAIYTLNVVMAKIVNSLFLNNKGHSGGGLFVEILRDHEAHITFDGCTFKGGLATSDRGGGVCIETQNSHNTTVSIIDSTFDSNNATKSGGGLYIFNLKTFTISGTHIASNNAIDSGGGMYTSGVFVSNISSSAFEKNMAKQAGAIYVFGSKNSSEAQKDWSISETIFFKNNASVVTGGAIYAKSGVTLRITESKLNFNSAKLDGGALNIVSEVGLVTALNIINSDFKNNTAGGHDIATGEYLRGDPNSGGGALSVQGIGAELNCSNSTFIGNKAGTGGAIMGSKSSSLEIKHPTMLNNSANQGGAVALKAAKTARLSNGTFNGNFARQGGAMYLTGSDFGYSGDFTHAKEEIQKVWNNANVWISHSEFSGNRAYLGGGALEITALSFLCNDCAFDSNYVDDVYDPHDLRGGGMKMRARALVLLHNTSISSCRAQKGGGISLEDAVLVAHNLSLLRNNASNYGGAIEITVEAQFTINERKLVECHGCTVQENYAKNAGVFYIVMEDEDTSKKKDASDSGGESPTDQPVSSPRHILLNDTKFSGNKVGSYGPIILFSKLHDLKICCRSESNCATGKGLVSGSCINGNLWDNEHRLLGTFMNHVGIEPEEVPPYLSGSDVPTLNVTLLDAFNHTAPLNATLMITSPDDRLELSGSPTGSLIIYETYSVVGITATAVPGSYQFVMNVTSMREGSQHLIQNVTLRVRKCTIGEHALNNNKGCVQCSEDFYNFEPDKKNCSTCPPRGARCNGTTLTPLDHYWHRSSHSKVVYPCLNQNACVYTNREKNLSDMAMENVTLERTWDAGYPLCREGFEGVLCGSCSDGDASGKSAQYGKNPDTMDCEECENNTEQILWTVAYIVIQGIMVVFFMREARDFAKEASSSESVCEDEFFRQGNRETEQDPDNIPKILVTFFQVSTIVTSTKVKEQSTMSSALEPLGWLSGMTTGHAYFALSCFFRNSHRFVYASLISSFLPLMSWMFFAFCGANKYFSGKKTPEDFTSSVNFLFVSAMALLDISYIGLTQKMVQFVYWKPVVLKNDESWYWTEDTYVTWEGTPLKTTMSIVGTTIFLVVVSLGFPIFLFYQIYKCKGRLLNYQVLSRYGYFYKAYCINYRYWELVVLGRKGLLAVFSVLSGALSDELKEYWALSVLLLALGFHTRYSPYRNPYQNTMETASLMVSCFACILEGMIRNPKGDQDIKKWLTVLNTLLVFGYVSCMAIIYLFLKGKSMVKLYRDADEVDRQSWELKIVGGGVKFYVSFHSCFQKLKEKFQEFCRGLDVGNQDDNLMFDSGEDPE